MSTTIRLQDSIKGSIEILSIDPPFSFFNFQENHFPNAYALKRLLSQVRAIQGKSMVIEMLDATTEIKEENEDSSIRCNFQIVSDVYRLSFFKDHIKIPKDIEQLSKDSFVGYIIIKRDFKKDTKRLLRERIFESIIAPSRFHNNFIHRKQQWEVKILGVNFSLNGYLYAQQNDLTNVCAHVAVRTAAACYHPNGAMLYREMNNLLGIDHRSRKVGEGRGLSVKELIYLMEQAGARCFLADYESTTEQPVPFQRLIYGSIESGFPSLVVFCFNSDSPNEDGNRHQSKHVIPIFGHTFNEDTWLPNANYFYFKLGPNIKYIPSDSWLSMFIGHDDNFGSNFCIPPR